MRSQLPAEQTAGKGFTHTTAEVGVTVCAVTGEPDYSMIAGSLSLKFAALLSGHCN